MASPVRILPAIVTILVMLASSSRSSPLPPVTVIDIAGDWEAKGDLPWQALLLSLQGNANRHDPRIYLLYPPDYVHPGVKDVLEYYQRRHGLRVLPERSLEAAVRNHRDALRGYVVWDPGSAAVAHGSLHRGRSGRGTGRDRGATAPDGRAQAGDAG